MPSVDPGSGVHIGQGVVLTAGHVVESDFQQVVGFSTDLSIIREVNLEIGEETFRAATIEDFFTGSEGVQTAATQFGFDPSISPNQTTNDFGVILSPRDQENTPDTINGGPPIIVFADPDDAFGQIWAGGFPRESQGDTGENFYETTGVLTTNSYEFGRPADNPFWRISSDSFDTSTGFSGSGVFLNYDVPGVSGTDFYLAGVITQGTANGVFAGPQPGINSSFVEPIGDHYVALATYLESQLYDLTTCLLYTSPSPRDATLSRMPSSA